MPQINDQAFLLNAQDFEEQRSVITVFTKDHGVCRALIKRDKIQSGDLIQFTWKSRKVDGLGFAKCELIQSYAIHFLFSYFRLKAVHAILQLISTAFAAHSADMVLFYKLMNFMDRLAKQNMLDPKLYIQFELLLLSRAGYGLSLDRCAVTKDKKNLYYLSPKSGCAISRDIGLAYHDKLFVLPQCFIHDVAPDSPEEFALCMTILDYFWNKCCALSDVSKICARQDIWQLMQKLSVG
ncbi:DNA repair protein RecO [Rickettsiales endosymbiont of Paramecium tredecaurelia]|uniref:DNA repair protein RecO n=1 Tax=Candidatus Sarmatiella mevalonica TaxID=2770581 RepID=UPI001923322B|nr:DNA repair protein RecO [Candidatus Sarmatiella mevalonica]MBL3284423.1 DNA repair protein RecO [Candidatus Sarmatiella mevalonica]